MMRAAVLFLLALGLLPTVRAQSESCAGVDPENYQQVYACLSSLQRSDGRAVAQGNVGTASCRTMIARYRGAVRSRGMGARELQADGAPTRYPSCALFARIIKDMSGQDAYWSGCLDYGSQPTAEHLGQCLKTVLPGYYGARSARMALRFQGCGEVVGAYEIGLRAATADNGLPTGYARPDCQLIADYLAQRPSVTASPDSSPAGSPTPNAPGQDMSLSPSQSPPTRVTPPESRQPQWAACLNYDPDNLFAHLRACLGVGRQMRRMRECREVQAAYMAQLKQAYGRLPENYIVLPCSIADDYLAEFRAEEEAEKQAALERKNEQERQQRAALVKDADDLRNNPPARPLFARPWLTWLILLTLLGTAGWGGWRFIRHKSVQRQGESTT